MYLRREAKCRRHEVMKKRPLTLLLLLVLVAAPGAPSRGGKLYKWVDEKGVIHFSDRRPEGYEKVIGILEERDVDAPPVPPEISVPEKSASARSPIEHAANCTFMIKGASRLGTGFFVSANGIAATCKHVVEGVQTLNAVLDNQKEYPLHIIAMSQKYDLALVQVLAPDKFPFLSLRDAENLVPGERLFTIGSSVGLQSTVTDGVFTGLRKLGRSEETLIQFSAPVNHGNSGGPLLDAQGLVIGVVSMKVLQLNNNPITGVGFAVPSMFFTEEFRYLIQ